jgi:hypothetical protein
MADSGTRVSPDASGTGDVVDMELVTTTFGTVKRARTQPMPANGGLSAAKVNVVATPTKLPTTPLAGRIKLLLRNLSSTQTVKIGSSSVTNNNSATDGFPLFPDETMPLEVGPDMDVYGICASGQNADIAILELKR